MSPKKKTLREEGQDFQDDQSLLVLAMDRYEDDRLLEAARLLRRVSDPDLLRSHPYTEILGKARRCENLVSNLCSPIDGNGKDDGDRDGDEDEGSEWTKQGECHGNRDTAIYYKMDKETNTKLTARLETPIESTLLVPLLSVLNESDLYATWFPRWTSPMRLGVTGSEKLQQNGRVNQTILVSVDMPWPLSAREVVINALACDDIDSNGHIALTLQTLEAGEEIGTIGEGPKVVPPPRKGSVRLDFDGGFLFRPCPPDHPTLKGSVEGGLNETELQTDLLLVSFSMFIDTKISFLPTSVINFVVRTVIGRIWDMFLKVAEDVREGKRPKHRAAIEKKRRTLFDWVEERVQVMLRIVQQQG